MTTLIPAKNTDLEIVSNTRDFGFKDYCVSVTLELNKNVKDIIDKSRNHVLWTPNLEYDDFIVTAERPARNSRWRIKVSNTYYGCYPAVNFFYHHDLSDTDCERLETIVKREFGERYTIYQHTAILDTINRYSDMSTSAETIDIDFKEFCGYELFVLYDANSRSYCVDIIGAGKTIHEENLRFSDVSDILNDIRNLKKSAIVKGVKTYEQSL